jgi:methyl-accepting chemotaxis protein
VARQIGLIVGVAVLALAATIALSLLRVRHLGHTVEQLANDQVERLQLAQRWQKNIEVNSTRVFAVIQSDGDDVQAYFKDVMAATTADTTDVKKRYLQLDTSAEGRQIQAELASAREAYMAARDQALALKKAGDTAQARTLAIGTYAPLMERYNAVAAKMVAFQARRSAEMAAEASALIASYRTTVLAAGCAGLGLLIALAWPVARRIRRSLGVACAAAHDIGEGNLARPIVVEGSGDVAQMLLAIQRMQTSLVQIVGEVRESSESVATGSSQIAVGNADLSQRTEVQASNLQQTAATMDELTSTVRHNADTAQQAAALAGSAAAAASQGGHLMDEVVRTMQNIATASTKITDIIAVIDSIAFQTNILALNAAVEAARAGDQGRGFAVVASEVRSLAQRSATAAREIKTLIGDSAGKVENGMQLVDNAGRSMDDIVARVKQVSELIAAISRATLEQTGGIGQVAQAVNQLDHATQQNAALVEESAAAAESLKHQAARLAGIVGVFTLSA